MTNNHKHETRLITRETRPELYAALIAYEEAVNDNRFRAAYRRAHPVLACISWCAESNWRIAAMIGGAILLGGLAEKVLP